MIDDPNQQVQRFSSRRQRLDQSFLRDRLRGAKSYDRIAGFFRSSLIEVAGEELESVTGKVRMVCNSDLRMEDVQTARAAAMAVRKSWSSAEPEKLLDSIGGDKLKIRFRKLFQLLSTEKLEVRVLPDEAFGLVHGKAGVIHLNGGGSTSFLGSVNESMTAWKVNYELMWEDSSADAVKWVQEEFDALWGSPAVKRN